MNETTVSWRSNFIKFVEEEKGVLLKFHSFYFTDEKTNTKTCIGSDSGDYPVTKERAIKAFNEMKE